VEFIGRNFETLISLLRRGHFRVRRLEDVGKKEIIITMILALLFVPMVSHADYFVVLRNGEVRSGPGSGYPIVDTVKGSEVFEIPSNFESRQGATWIPIEWREVPKAAEVKGWFQLSTKTEYAESGEIVEGWYLSTLENIRNVAPGEILYFIMQDEPEKLRYGEMLAKINKEKTLGGLIYRKGRFKLKEKVPTRVEVAPEIGRFYWFFTGGCQGDTTTGTLVERLMQRKSCVGQTYELGLFRVSAGFETLYTRWVHVGLGERVDEPDVAHRLYEIRKSGFPMGVQADILDRRIWTGMTKEMARLSWGDPSWVNTGRSKRQGKEQWVYDYGAASYYLYFQNGILASYRKMGQGMRR
jgi:hypothetical protein